MQHIRAHKQEYLANYFQVKYMQILVLVICIHTSIIIATNLGRYDQRNVNHWIVLLDFSS